MKRIPFSKLSGVGNDFILVEAARLKGAPPPALARRLCPRRVAVGADGLLVVRRRAGKAPGVDYYNADGSRAFCGNGTRCAAWWMHRRGWVGRRFCLSTIAGPVDCEVAAKESVRIGLPPATGLRPSLRLAGRPAGAVTVGVPHVVVRVRGLARFPVFARGRALRRKAGANVDFVSLSRTGVDVRTYERGVEEETLSCGSGAAAAALLACVWAGLRPPIAVRTRGGTLKVALTRAGEGFEELSLEGPARIIYEGEVAI